MSDSVVSDQTVSLLFIHIVEFSQNTVELQWLEHLWDYENKFETGLVQANED